VDGRKVDATVSVGVASTPDHGGSVADIIASADGALYRAKQLGRNRVALAENPSSGPRSGTVIRIA
jgi:diguanylate cyclase